MPRRWPQVEDTWSKSSSCRRTLLLTQASATQLFQESYILGMHRLSESRQWTTRRCIETSWEYAGSTDKLPNWSVSNTLSFKMMSARKENPTENKKGVHQGWCDSVSWFHSPGNERWRCGIKSTQTLFPPFAFASDPTCTWQNLQKFFSWRSKRTPSTPYCLAKSPTLAAFGWYFRW